MLKYPVVSLAAILLIAVSAACTVVGAPTPEEAARQNSVRISPQSEATFQVVGKRQWQRGVVVLFTYTMPAEGGTPPMQIFGYSMLEPTAWGMWRATRSSAGGSSAPPLAENLVDFQSATGGPNAGNFAIVAGRTVAPHVAAVEAVFDNGQVLRDDTGDGVFALLAPASAVCELRVLDVDGNVLRRIDLAARVAPGKWPGVSPDNCTSKENR